MKIATSILVLAVYLLLTRKRLNKNYLFWSFFVVLYMSVAFTEVVGFPSLNEIQHFTSQGESLIHLQLNLIPFREGFDISSILNVIFFIPLGIALPVMWSKFTKFLPTVLYGFIFSLFIEVAQVFTLHRVSDIDDLLMNTVGVIIGWILTNYLLRWRAFAKNDRKNIDWSVYLVLTAVVCFCL